MASIGKKGDYGKVYLWAFDFAPSLGNCSCIFPFRGITSHEKIASSIIGYIDVFTL